MARALALAAALSLGLAAGAALAAAPVVVQVHHSGFDPASVKVEKGGTVVFHNADEMPGGHTVAADDGSFQSPPLAKGQEFKQSFPKAGTVKIHIVQHPNAKGEVVVE